MIIEELANSLHSDLLIAAIIIAMPIFGILLMLIYFSKGEK